jgi:hypothetical protein
MSINLDLVKLLPDDIIKNIKSFYPITYKELYKILLLKHCKLFQYYDHIYSEHMLLNKSVSRMIYKLAYELSINDLKSIYKHTIKNKFINFDSIMPPPPSLYSSYSGYYNEFIRNMFKPTVFILAGKKKCIIHPWLEEVFPRLFKESFYIEPELIVGESIYKKQLVDDIIDLFKVIAFSETDNMEFNNYLDKCVYELLAVFILRNQYITQKYVGKKKLKMNEQLSKRYDIRQERQERQRIFDEL